MKKNPIFLTIVVKNGPQLLNIFFGRGGGDDHPWKEAKSGGKWRKAAKSCERRREKRRKAAKSWKKWGFFFINGRRRPIWMTENHFRSHFSPFQINMQLFVILFSKWPPAAILDPDFLSKSIDTYLYSRSMARSNMKLIGAFLMKLWSAQAFSSYFHKMAVGASFWFSDFLQNR